MNSHAIRTLNKAIKSSQFYICTAEDARGGGSRDRCRDIQRGEVYIVAHAAQAGSEFAGAGE